MFVLVYLGSELYCTWSYSRKQDRLRLVAGVLNVIVSLLVVIDLY